jgi:hypothetical protein
MAASSCCRRAKLRGIGSSLTFGQKEAAALIVQSRRWSYGRVKWAAARRLFSFAVVRQLTSLLLLKWGNQKNSHNNKIYSIYGISHGIAPREACFWMFESKKHKGDGNDQHYQANYSGSFLCHFYFLRR